MSPRSERQKQRYAEDPDYRARILASNLRYATAHKEEIAEKARIKWATDPEFRAKGLAASRARDSRADSLKQLYGLSLQDYDAMLRAQNGVCAICKRNSKTKLCVDHDHGINVVRGLLCHNCNHGLGCFRDDPRRIAAAIAYRRANGAGVRAALGRVALAPNPKKKPRPAVPLSRVPDAQQAGQCLSRARRKKPRPAVPCP
jgi:Recombination endonuclease VII